MSDDFPPGARGSSGTAPAPPRADPDAPADAGAAAGPRQPPGQPARRADAQPRDTLPGPTAPVPASWEAQTLDGSPADGCGAPLNLVGMVIADRYEVLEKVGQGSMGAVYVARHKTLGSRFAIKVMLAGHAAEDSQRFLSEAQLASKVNHPNTVYIADFGTLPSGAFYLVMEFLRGSTLAEVISQGPLPPARACAIAAQIAHGLSAVHKKGIIHRDLKPENIFLTEEEGRPDFVKIVDFGIAKATTPELDKAQAVIGAESSPAVVRRAGMPSAESAAARRLTMPGSVLGTPDYMPPEQARGGEADFRADQYALGCILYEMLCGSVPFAATTLIGLLRKHLSEAPVPLAQRAPERKIPPSLDALVLRLLSKKPGERLASMQAVAQALEQEGEQLRRRPRGRPGTKVLAAVLGGSLLLGIPLAVRHRPTAVSVPATVTRPSPGELAAAKGAAIAALKEQLGSPSRDVRYAVLGALGQSRDSAFGEPVAALLTDPDVELAAQAAATLGQLGDRRLLPRLQSLLSSAPLRLRLSIARALLDLDDESGRQTLAALLGREKDPEVTTEIRLQAAFLLCDTGDATAQRLLGALAELETTQAATVLDILTCLGRSPQPLLARQQLRARFHAQKGAERIPLAARLSQLGDGEGRDFLRELARRPGPEQLAAACALAAPAEPELAPLFRRTLRATTDEPTRLLATAALGLVGEPEDVPALTQQLAAAAAPALRRSTAVAILSICSREPAALSESSLGWVQQALSDPSWKVRADAVAVLAHSPASQSVLLLCHMLGDSVPAVRAGAARALGMRREASALMGLRTGLGDSDASVRTEVVKALAQLGGYLRYHGLGQVAQEIAGWLPTDDSVLAVPQWQKTALLLALGNDNLRGQLQAWQERALPEEQRVLLDMGITDPAFLLGCLKSADLAIRLTAAGRLAEQNDGRGLEVIEQAVQRGGALALTAYGLLAKLGKSVPDAPLRAALDVAAPLAERLAVVAMAAALPAERALSLWQQAAADPERLVRRAVVDAIARALAEGSGSSAAPVLRTLLRDSDPRVRGQAAAVLAAMLAPEAAGSMPPAATAPARLDGGSGVDLAASSVRGAVDAGVMPDPFDLGSAAGPEDGRAETDPAGAPFEVALRAGIAANRQKDYGRAQKLLLRARALCAALHPAPERCRTLLPEATWQLAQLHDSQQHQSEAMAEYQRLTHDRHFASMGVEQQIAVQTAIVRLTLQLGQVVLSSRAGDRCHKEIQWLTPGPKTVKVGGKPRQIIVRAGEQQEVGDCQ